MEGTVLFYFTNFQYVASCLTFSISKPYRKPMWSNYPLFISVILITALDILLMIVPASNPIMFYFFSGFDFCTEGTDPVTDLGPFNHSGTCYPSYIIKIC